MICFYNDPTNVESFPDEKDKKFIECKNALQRFYFPLSF